MSMDNETHRSRAAFAAAKALRLPNSSKAAKSAAGSAFYRGTSMNPVDSANATEAAKKALRCFGASKAVKSAGP
jgi:hypothetical protein